MAANVLVVDDDPQMADLIATVLELAGHHVSQCGLVSQALELARRSVPDLAVVDLGLPDGSGLDLVDTLAAKYPGMGIMIVTADDRDTEHVKGFNFGADDVIVKPFRVSSLVARTEAVLRRRGPKGSSTSSTHIGDLVIDEASVTATRAGTAIDLTATEFRLLAHLAQNPNRVLSRNQLLTAVWGYDFAGDGAVVERFVSTLRRKLGEPDLIHTVRGFGYTLRAPQ